MINFLRPVPVLTHHKGGTLVSSNEGCPFTHILYSSPNSGCYLLGFRLMLLKANTNEQVSEV